MSLTNRDDSWLQPAREQWDNTSGVPFGEWVHQQRQGTEEDRNLGERIADVFRQASRPPRRSRRDE